MSQQPQQTPHVPLHRAQAQRAAVRQAPPFPWDSVAFPAALMPYQKRRRGPSARRMFYLGRHPLALLIEMAVTLTAVMFIFGWVALVAAVWALWFAAVAAVWGCRAAAAKVRR